MTAVAPALTPTQSTTDRHNRPAVVFGAIVLLLAIYGLLSLFNDPRGTLGTDTGGKLATLSAMDHRGSFDPDIGYWAEEYDPTGVLHPLYYTRHIEDRWVNLTTVPMVIAAEPLYEVGGPRLVLLLPMLGAAFSALAARALARRIAGGDGWWAFWTVALASPIAIYALDFWEHAPGVAFVLWGIVFGVDVARGDAGWRGALVSGVLFAAAATMRTDALVYAATTTLVLAWVMLARWRKTGTPAWAAMVTAGIGWVAGFGGVLLANQLLERAVVGGAIRAGRTADTAGGGGHDVVDRLKEAFTTAVGINRFDERTDWLLGALMVALVAYAAWKLMGPERRDTMLGATALVGAFGLYVLRFADGLGFVPGVLSASPLAVAGLAVGWTVKKWRIAGAIAVITIPLVWFFQYSGGANPQWGGRYLLSSGTLLVVGAAVVISATPGRVRIGFVALAALVTLGGAMWLSQRSHAVASAMPHLAIDGDTVLVSREAHLLREGGDFYRPGQQWMTAVNDKDLAAAVDIAERVGASRLELAAVTGRSMPSSIGGYERTGKRRVEFLPGLDIVIVSYTNEGAQ